MTSPTIPCPRCANANAPDAFNCNRCGTALRAVAPPAAAPAVAVTPSLSSLQTHVMLEKAKVRSPTLALIIGFFLPSIGAIYNGKILIGLALLVVEVITFGLSFVSFGIPRLIYGLFGAYINHKWATRANLDALEKALQKATP
jgi:hypothetical protein